MSLVAINCVRHADPDPLPPYLLFVRTDWCLTIASHTMLHKCIRLNRQQPWLPQATSFHGPENQQHVDEEAHQKEESNM